MYYLPFLVQVNPPFVRAMSEPVFNNCKVLIQAILEVHDNLDHNVNNFLIQEDYQSLSLPPFFSLPHFHFRLFKPFIFNSSILT